MVKVQDGDTLTVLVDRKQVRVRLTDIDAPERKQAFGTRSRQSLANLCAGKDARVVDQGKDRFGRSLGRISCAGVNAKAEQVRRGMAWVLVRYAPKGLPLYAVQAEARAARRGLWQVRSQCRRGMAGSQPAIATQVASLCCTNDMY